MQVLLSASCKSCQISAFLEDVHHGPSLGNTKNPSDKTICGYMTSVAEAWTSKALTGMMVPLLL
jgi:hypothetical protein